MWSTSVPSSVAMPWFTTALSRIYRKIQKDTQIAFRNTIHAATNDVWAGEIRDENGTTQNYFQTRSVATANRSRVSFVVDHVKFS